MQTNFSLYTAHEFVVDSLESIEGFFLPLEYCIQVYQPGFLILERWIPDARSEVISFQASQSI